MGLKSRIGWLVYGSTRTQATFAGQAAELRALRDEVAALTSAVRRLEEGLARNEAGDTTAAKALQDQLRTVTDDLGDRVGALAARVEALRQI